MRLSVGILFLIASLSFAEVPPTAPSKQKKNVHMIKPGDKRPGKKAAHPAPSKEAPPPPPPTGNPAEAPPPPSH